MIDIHIEAIYLSFDDHKNIDFMKKYIFNIYNTCLIFLSPNFSQNQSGDKFKKVINYILIYEFKILNITKFLSITSKARGGWVF